MTIVFLINLYVPYLSQKERQVTFLVEDYVVLTEILESLRKEKITVLNYEMHKDAEENNGRMLVSIEIRMKRYDNFKEITSILKNFEKVELVQVL